MKNLILFIFLSVALVSCEDMINGAITPVQVGNPNGSGSSSTTVGTDDIPTDALIFIRDNYPDATIRTATFKDGIFTVTLDDGTTLTFDENGELIGTENNNPNEDNDGGEDEDGGDANELDGLPDEIIDFIDENFPADIVDFEFNDGFYTVKLDNGWIVVFDEEGNLISVDD